MLGCNSNVAEDDMDRRIGEVSVLYPWEVETLVVGSIAPNLRDCVFENYHFDMEASRKLLASLIR